MSEHPDQPNVIFILIDDMGWMDLTCQGSPFYETPNIDRLAKGGMTFTDAYAACPVCSPTRASIMSGKYPARVGVTQYIGGNGKGKLLGAPYTRYLPLEEQSLGRALNEGGYQTWHVGKWHLGSEEYYPEHHGFDVNVGGCHMGAPFRGDGYFAPWGIPNLPDEGIPKGTYLDDYLTDRAVELIQQRDPGRPFYLNMWHYLVHTPLQAKDELIEKYRAKAVAMGLDDSAALEAGELHPCAHKLTHRVMRRRFQSHPVYAAMIEILDQNVGKLLDELDRQGIANNTIVIFTSDNGGLSTSEGSPTCNAPLKEGKGWMEEGGNREPLLIRWPKRIAPGTKTDAIVTSPDFYPTLLEAGGLPLRPAQHVDGVSFLPTFDGESIDRGPIFWHYPHYSNQGGTPGCSVRDGDYKLMHFFEDGERRLYNLKDDIGEARNLIDDEPELAARLGAQLDAWLVEIEAIIPQPNPDYVHPADPSADPSV